MLEKDPLQSYIHKKVLFRYNKKEFYFALSQGLFSSNDIDRGTKRLLASISGNVNVNEVKRIWDVGCGVGVIGIALKKVIPDATVLATDRDRLALDVTEFNSRLNGVNMTTEERLLAESSPHPETFDLIVSNIPAKAGESVIEQFLREAPSFLSKGGRCCTVIVEPLALFAESVINKSHYKILYREATSQYTVLHYRGEREADYEASPLPSCYSRGRNKFSLRGGEYQLTASYGLPDFDTPGYKIDLAIKVLRKASYGGDILVYNPGQGHIPCWLLAKASKKAPLSFTLAGRDILQLRTTKANLELIEEQVPITIEPLAGEIMLNRVGAYDLSLINLEPITKTEWERATAALLPSCVKEGGLLLLLGRSSHLAQLAKEVKKFTPIGDERSRGYRAILYRRN